MTTLEACIKDDHLIQDLLAVVGKKVEVFAFGVTYVGVLTYVDPENGFISVADGEDAVMLELERVESFNVIGV